MNVFLTNHLAEDIVVWIMVQKGRSRPGTKSDVGLYWRDHVFFRTQFNGRISELAVPGIVLGRLGLAVD